MPLVEITDLTKTFQVGRQTLTAVESFSLSIQKGETVGLVGESGCGKTTVGRTLLRLSEPTRGRVVFDGKELASLTPSALKQMRRRMQIIFQDPYASLNPRMTIQDIVEEPLRIHGLPGGKTRVLELLKRVGLNANHLSRFPHEFSGGQRQRIGIARALAVNPEFIVCDEPISALDVSIQAQIVNLLKELQKERNLTYLFIAHDLSLVKYISDRVAVMYLGHLMELAPSEKLYSNPLHPYTQALLSAIPIPDPIVEKKRQRIVLKGDPPSLLKPMQGCPFASRCPLATDLCRTEKPILKQAQTERLVACHYSESKD